MLAGILLIAVLSRTAHADPERSEVVPVPAWSIGLAMAAHSGTVAGQPSAGYGPSAELAIGARRTQLFLEGGPQWIWLGMPGALERGLLLRGAVGARYLARSFELGGAGAMEMLIEGVGGAQKIWLAADDITRPELAFGIGFQVRRYARRQITMRVSIRAMFTPGGAHSDSAARTTQPSSAFANGGPMVLLGGAM